MPKHPEKAGGIGTHGREDLKVQPEDAGLLADKVTDQKRRLKETRNVRTEQDASLAKLIEMGYDPDKSSVAVKETAGCENAGPYEVKDHTANAKDSGRGACLAQLGR